MKTKIQILMLCLWITASTSAQTASDALRYSYLSPGGTARTLGAGSATSVLGADFAALSTNPAGLAAFRRSELTFTPALSVGSTKSLMNGEGNSTFKDAKTNFHFANIGLVFTRARESARWRTLNFGIGYNRLANFSNRFYYQGNTQGSLTDRFLEQTQGGASLDPFESDLAYQTGAIFDSNSDGKYETDYQEGNPGGYVFKKQTVTTKGSVGELVFSFAGNYEEKIMLGATLGVPFVSYSEAKSYVEDDKEDETPIFNSLSFNENLKTTGTGVNLKLGLIYRPIQLLRLGLAVHSPTAYFLSDEFSTSMTYDYTLNGTNSNLTKESPSGSFKYNLYSPWRFIGSTGVIIGKKGFVSAEAEWTDYRNARFSTDNGEISDQEYLRVVNDTINHRYQSSLNLRIGGEYAIKIFRLRAGFGLNGAPYLNDNTYNKFYSFGVGLREENYFLDLAYRVEQLKEGYRPYEVSSNYFKQKVINTTTNSLVALTAGFKF